MDAKTLKKLVDDMTAKYGEDIVITRYDSTFFFRDIGALHHVDMDGKEFLIIT